MRKAHKKGYSLSTRSRHASTHRRTEQLGQDTRAPSSPTRHAQKRTIDKPLRGMQDSSTAWARHVRHVTLGSLFTHRRTYTTTKSTVTLRLFFTSSLVGRLTSTSTITKPGTILQPQHPRRSTQPYRFPQHVHRDRHACEDTQQLFDVHAPPDPFPLRGSRPRHLVRPHTLPYIPEPAVQGAKSAAPYDHAENCARAETVPKRHVCGERKADQGGTRRVKAENETVAHNPAALRLGRANIYKPRPFNVYVLSQPSQADSELGSRTETPNSRRKPFPTLMQGASPPPSCFTYIDTCA